MLIRAKDENYYNIEFKPMTEDDWNILRKDNKNSRYFEFQNTLEDYGEHNPDGDEYGYEFLNYSIFVEGKLAGCVFGDDISDREFIREFVAGTYILEKYRGIGLNGIALDSLALMSDISRIYLIIHTDNIASVKSSRGFSLYRFQRPDEDERFLDYVSDDDIGNLYIFYKDY